MKAYALFLFAALVLASGVARAQAAQARRVAVVVGANKGALGRSSLRYSYRDAQQISDVLTQVGQFAPADVHVLSDPEPDVVLFTLDRELAALRAVPGESLLVFYYSGHADAAALYPGGKPLSFGKLRERLESPWATVRLGIIDACSGGGWTGAKGLKPDKPFAVDVPLQLAGEGSVLISSSSGLEDAHESEGLLGSFFTHHLVAALRGAADPRGDGVVTLTDAFAYAKERTVRDTAAIAEPQHPSFFMNLRGRSDLPLSRVGLAETLVELSESAGPLQLIHLSTGLIVLEVPAGRRALKLSVPPGRYLLRRQGKGGNYSREIAVEPGATVAVNEDELQLVVWGPPSAKHYQSGVAAWPLAVNDRPLTLSRGLAQLDVGFLIGASDGSAFGSPLGLAPAAHYGATDWLTLSIGAPGGVCLGSSHCDRLASGLAGDAAFALPTLGPIELLADLSVGYNGGNQSFPLRVSATARAFGGGFFALLVTPEFTYLKTTSASSSTWGYGVTGQLVFQPLEALALDLVLPLTRPYANVQNQETSWRAKLVGGATYAVNHHLDVRAWLSLDNLLASGTAAPGDARTLGLMLSYRP